MITFSYCSREEAINRLSKPDHKYDRVISICSPDMNAPIFHIPQLVLRFNDVNRKESIESKGLIPCNQQHIETARRFANLKRTSGDVLIHCNAGFSRSPALAMCLEALSSLKHRADDCWDQNERKYEHIIPNKFVLQCFEYRYDIYIFKYLLMVFRKKQLEKLWSLEKDPNKILLED